MTDYDFGEYHENNTHQIINNFFKCEFKKTEKYATFDFINKIKKVCVELKTRKNKKYEYPTTMITYSKVRKGMQYVRKGYKVYFVFKFTDQISYYELIKPDLDYIDDGLCGRSDRGRPEYNKYYMIPVDVLSDF
jgi:hypothetical protein